jgi:hypothetical protein
MKFNMSNLLKVMGIKQSLNSSKKIRNRIFTLLFSSLLVITFQNCSSSKPQQSQSNSEGALDNNGTNPLLPGIDDDGGEDGDDSDTEDPEAGNQIPSSFYGWWMSPGRSEIVHLSQTGEVLVYLEDINTANLLPLCAYNSTVTATSFGVGFVSGSINLRDAKAIGIQKSGSTIENTYRDDSFCSSLVNYNFKHQGTSSLCFYGASESVCSDQSLALKKVSYNNTVQFLKRWVLAEDSNVVIDLRIEGGAGLFYWSQNQCAALAFVGGVLEGNTRKAVLHITAAEKIDSGSSASCGDMNGTFNLELDSTNNQLKAQARSGKALEVFGANIFILKE